MKANPGHLPPDAAGKRVRVMLACGRLGRCDDNPMSPPGWPADTTRWSITGSSHDVAAYEVL